jgi:hypothetical protein
LGIIVPEVTCPNCGLTINLENRREIDYDLIMGATKKSATFTELLHATKLSRKTLSIRLKELCRNGAIVKGDGVYKLGNSSQVKNHSMRSLQVENLGGNLLRTFRDRRLRTVVWMLMLVTSFSVSGYVLARYFASSPPLVHNEPVIIGYSTMALEVSDVNDLYSWEAVISFNATELKVLQVTPGDFVGQEFPLFCNSTDTGEGLLLVEGCLEGDVAGKSGSGTLATIVFGYFTSNYKAPLIVPKQMGFETFLEDSELADMPIGTKLSLEVLS